MEWMTTKQKKDFESICILIDLIDSPKAFYRTINEINAKYDIDVVNCAREYKKCYNSAQYM